VSPDNQEVYDSTEVARHFDEALGWIDRGEQAALLSIASTVRGKRLLDIGVGTGRTFGLLSLLSDSYIGIDYSMAMVSACRHKYPEADIRLGDARDLSPFDNDSVDFVLFSFNGIDTLDESGRRSALEEIHRVLDDGGVFVFSTLNKDGCSYGEKPLQLHRPGQPWDRRLKTFARFLWRNSVDPLRHVRRYRNWRSARLRTIDVDGWAMKPLSVLDFSLVNHFVTLERLREELESVRFDIVAIYESGNADIHPISPEARRSTTDWFHVVARKSEPCDRENMR